MLSKKSLLKELLYEYEEIQTQLKRRRAMPVQGVLEVSQRNYGGFYYYHTLVDKDTGQRTRKYLPKAKVDIARRLANQAYYKSIQKLLDKRIPQLSNLVADIEDSEIDNIYRNLHPGRKALVKPIRQLPEHRLEEWVGEKYSALAYPKQNSNLISNQSEQVRSKSEKILADKFDNYGIPYKYECPLAIGTGWPIYPDFTFLNPYSNQEIYWEHFGLMADQQYTSNTIKKINLYEQYGINLGERLIVTFETYDCPLDTKVADSYIERKLLPLFSRARATD